jgi:integrase/recombinase XerD
MASIKIILRDKITKEGLFPVVLRIIKDRKPKLISLGMECLKKDWDEATGQFKKNHTNYLQRNRVLLNIKVKALKIIDDFNLEGIDFTLTQFEEKFRGKSGNNVSVVDFWNNKINDLTQAGRIGNAKAYNETKKSFFKFSQNKQMLFKDITPPLLDKYETYLRANKNEDGGISVKMRQLRAVYNDAIRNELVDNKHYPFKAYKISKLKKSNNKRALMRSEIKLIEELNENKYPHLVEAKKLFVFSYYSRGMNFHDIMKLRWSNIEGDKIVYIRSKTKGKFAVKILKPVEEILSYYKSLQKSTDYIFPILLKEGLTPTQIDNRKTAKLKKFNKDLKDIAQAVGINKPITSYVARHSFATNLKEKGISTDIISQSMGHRDVGITTVYLKDFDNDIIDDANEKLLQEPLENYNQLRFAV